MGRAFSCVDGDGKQLVLKLSPPRAAPALEAAALRLWRGHAAASLLDWDPAAGALLLERVLPGTPLPSGQAPEAIRVAASILRDLHGVGVPVGHPFPTTAEAFEIWLDVVRAEAEPGTAGVALLAQAHSAARRLWSTSRETVLLHGDFLDKNLLLGPAGFVAVDPMPRLGDPCSDIGFFAAAHPPARDIGSRARALAQALGRDPERAERWAAVWAVGEACETWRADSDELQAWMTGGEAARLLAL